MELYDRVPDILDINFDASNFAAFPDIDLKEEDFSSLKELDMDYSFFDLDDSVKPCDPLASMVKIEQDQEEEDMKPLMDFDQHNFESTIITKGEKRSYTDLMTDLDTSDKLRRDCMWSSSGGHCSNSAAKTYRPDYSSAPSYSYTSNTLMTDDLLSMTPPTSYIHQYIEQFQEVLSNCSDEVSSVGSSEESDWTMSEDREDVSLDTSSSCGEESPNLSTVDHSYYTNPMNESSILTPPESSDDDEDSQEVELVKQTSLRNVCNDFAAKNSFSTTTSTMTTMSLPRSETKLNTQTLRQQIQRIAQDRKPQPKFTFKIQLKTKMKHLKGLKRLQQSRGVDRVSKFAALQSSINAEKPKDARDLHNHMERQRRNELRNSFEFLKRHIPSVAKSDRASKQLILDKSIEFVKVVRTRELELNKQRQALNEKKIALQKKLMALQRQSST